MQAKAAMRSILHIAALTSSFLAVLLATGYAGKFGLALSRLSPTGFWMVNPKASSGRVVCYVTIGSAVARGSWVPPSTPGFHLRFQGEFDPLRLDVRRAVWDYDAHTLGRSLGSTTYILAAPIWCFELPLLIAPLLWLRQRRRRRSDPTGFPVRTSEAAS